MSKHKKNISVENKLLSREDFKKFVFLRDKNKCVNCRKPAVDAHHIIERKLFSDGGYYLDNGVSVCEDCHLQAEYTIITCEHLRKMAGINNIILPENYDKNKNYDKWGNVIIDSYTRVKGLLYESEQFQKILKNSKLNLIFHDNGTIT